MKKQFTYIIILLFFSFGKSYAQCDQPTAQYAIHGNNIKANILTGGDLFWDLQNAKFQVPFEDDNSPSSIFSAGLFMGGFTAGGSMKLAGSTYRNGNNPSHYIPGPLTDVGVPYSPDDCQNFDRIWGVKGIDIQAHINDFADNGVIDNPITSIMGWPASGNPNFEDIYGFELPARPIGYAPFFDNVTPGVSNAIGVYEPHLGDFPEFHSAYLASNGIFPSEMTWCVFNDLGSPFESVRAEIQLTTFTFECSDNEIINNTLFTSYKIINRAVEDVDSFYISMWVDFDLGCYTDDQIGCSPEKSTFFAYNRTNIDGPCEQGIPSYGENPPVQAVTILGRPIDEFGSSIVPPLSNFIVADASVPASSFNTGEETYRMLTGTWSDDTPLTQGGNGYNVGSTDIVNHHYSDDPNDASGWSMETSNSSISDYQVFGSTKIGKLKPGAILQWDLAWSYHRGDGNDRLENVSLMFDEVDQIQMWYDAGFSNVCSTTAVEQIDISESIQVYPNPTSGFLNIDFLNKKINQIKVLDSMGRVVLEDRTERENSIQLDLEMLPQGIYFLQGETEEYHFNKKIIIVD